MTDPIHPPFSRPKNWLLIGLLALGLLAGFAALDNQSYWIDEAGTVCKAAPSSLGGWWQAMRSEGNSNLQLPFYLLYIWGWAKLAGLQEWALRVGNLPWFLLGVAALALGARKKSSASRWAALLLLLSSFAWYYVNEARPYAVQIGASCVVFAALLRLGSEPPDSAREERRWIIILCLGSLVLAASGMLAMLWLGAYGLAVLISTPSPRLRALIKTYRVGWGVTLALLFALGLFYLWTLKIGARATLAGTTDARNVMFIFYELLGFTGLGPGRVEIRNAGLAAFRPWVPWLAAFGAVQAVVIFCGLRRLAVQLPRRTLLGWLVAFLLVLGFILTVGVADRFRVLGRHCTPLLPLLIFIQASGLLALWEKKSGFGRGLVAVFLGLSLASCLGLRFGERHAKDDYRAAARTAREALQQGQSVWWSADSEGAWVYQVPLTNNFAGLRPAVLVVNPTDATLAVLPPPDMVVASKPDLYDGGGALQLYLTQNHYRQATNFFAFTVWQKDFPPAPRP